MALFRIKQLLLGWWAGGYGYPRLSHNLWNQRQVSPARGECWDVSAPAHPGLSRALAASSGIPELPGAPVPPLPYLDGEGERHEAQAAEVHVEGVEDGPDQVVAGRGGGGGRPPLGGRPLLPRVRGVHGHGEGHPRLRQPRGSAAGPSFISLLR